MQESVKGQWNGDIDLGDQTVALLHQEYQQRKSLCKASDLLSSKDHLMARLQKLLDCLYVDVTFLADGLFAAQDAYTKKFGSCLLWVMSTEISVDIAVDTRSI